MNKIDLNNKVAIITGGARGIGYAVAERFLASGASVVLWDLLADKLEESRKALSTKGSVAVATVDVRKDESIQAALDAAIKQFGRADILVNSAGFTRMVAHSDLDALDDDLIDQVLTANVRGPFATIRAFVPLLRESGDGVIVNISSGAAQSGTGSSIIYGASKAALNTMSMALARVLGPEIRVVVVAPGMVHTGFVPGRTEEMMARAAMATPLKRAIEAEDVALAVLACVTHLTHTTGSIISVDAGRHL